MYIIIYSFVFFFFFTTSFHSSLQSSNQIFIFLHSGSYWFISSQTSISIAFTLFSFHSMNFGINKLRGSFDIYIIYTLNLISASGTLFTHSLIWLSCINLTHLITSEQYIYNFRFRIRATVPHLPIFSFRAAQDHLHTSILVSLESRPIYLHFSVSDPGQGSPPTDIHLLSYFLSKSAQSAFLGS